MKIAAFVAPLAALSFYAAAPLSFAADGRSINSINGEVTARSGETYDTVNTVNGDLTVSRGATVGTAKTVNGEITVEGDATIGSLSTVNGEVEIGPAATVSGSASTVNGEIKVASRAKVGGDVSTVSGSISLEGSEVTGTVTTVNGDIDLQAGAHVRGDLVVKRPNNKWSPLKKEDPVKVHVCATCVIDGDLHFERPVELRVDAGGKTGKVIGDEVTRR